MKTLTIQKRNLQSKGTCLGSVLPIQSHVSPCISLSFYLLESVQEAFERGLVNGIRQGCANTFTTLKDRIELIRDTNQVYTAYTLACNGKHLGITKIVLDINSDDDNGPIHIYSFVEDKTLPIDPLVGPNGEQSVGIKALYALLRLSPEKLGYIQGKTIVDEHHLMTVLGKGSFSTVYRARRLSDGAIVALKMPHFLPPGFTINSTREKMNHPILTELAVLVALQTELNPHIPQLSPQQCAIDATWKWVSVVQVGITLSQYLATTFTTQKERVAFAKGQLLRDLLSAVQCAHSKGYGHCDIRPENVIMFEGRVVLIDWGLSSKLGEPRHRLTGGYFFFHDEIARSDPFASSAVITTAEQDLVGVEYVAVAVIYYNSDANDGCYHFPWKGGYHVSEMIRIRSEHVAYHLHGGPQPALLQEE